MAKLTAIMDDPEAETGDQLRAIRLLIGHDLKSTIRHIEVDKHREQVQRDRLDGLVGLVLEQCSDVGPELAERFARACLEHHPADEPDRDTQGPPGFVAVGASDR